VAPAPRQTAGPPTSHSLITEQQPRFDLVRLPVQDGVHIEVYWRSDDQGQGPAASLYVKGVEVLRLDCFGGDQGHMHINAKGRVAKRWYFPEGTVADHIERANFELGTNVEACLRLNQDPGIAHLNLDPKEMKVVATEARRLLLELAGRHVQSM
jgi:hypothetical protein